LQQTTKREAVTNFFENVSFENVVFQKLFFQNVFVQLQLEVATNCGWKLQHTTTPIHFGMNLQQTGGGSCNKLRMEIATIYEMRLEVVTTCGWRLQ
jgi:hypothetical protein